MLITKQQIRLFLMAAFILISAGFLWSVRQGLYPFFIAFFLAYLLNPPVYYLESKGFKRIYAILVVYIVVFTILCSGVTYFFPILIRELEAFSRDIPTTLNHLEKQLQLLQLKYQSSALPYSLRLAMDNRIAQLQAEGQSYINFIIDSLIGLIGHIFGLAISPILAFYLLLDWYIIKEKIMHSIPSAWRSEFTIISKDFDKVLGGVIRGQLSVAFIVGVLVSFGLQFLKVKYALLIGIFAGMLDLIPYFGAVIGALPAIGLALLESPFLALKVAVLFVAIHQFEGTIIGPQILGDNVGLHPMTVIFCVFIGSEIGGLAGMLLAVPITALGKILLVHLVKALV